jgi:hypothetical protein
MIRMLILTIFLCSSCSLLNKRENVDFDCGRYTILHDLKLARKSSIEDSVILWGVTRYCDDNSIAKGTIVRIVDKDDKVLFHTVSDKKGRYILVCKSGAFKVSALNPGGGIVETAIIDFGLNSMSTKINLYMQHPNAFIDRMEDPRSKKN